jgi:hypothetical protein
MKEATDRNKKKIPRITNEKSGKLKGGLFLSGKKL